MDLDATLALATDLAREAGALAARMREGITVLETKSSPVDVVTAADKAVEELIVDALTATRPADGLLGEEGSGTAGSSGYRWVIDPIDGTVNYLYGIPQWAVSIGFEDAAGALVGVVYDPVKDELWQAVRGGGAVLNGRPLACTSVASFDLALIGTGFSYAQERRAHQARVLPILLPLVRDIRRLGSGALDLCSVAAGRIDGYYEQGLSPWDLCAGGLIAAEAGALVTGLRGTPAGAALVVAAGPALHPQLVALLEEHDADALP